MFLIRTLIYCVEFSYYSTEHMDTDWHVIFALHKHELNVSSQDTNRMMHLDIPLIFIKQRVAPKVLGREWIFVKSCVEIPKKGASLNLVLSSQYPLLNHQMQVELSVRIKCNLPKNIIVVKNNDSHLIFIIFQNNCFIFM